MRKGGVEPPHQKALDPKSSVSTNSTTFADATKFIRKQASFQ